MTSTTANTSPLRHRTRIATGITAGIVLAVALPLAASAHVHVTPEEAASNGSTRLDFSFSHGCDGSPTTALIITIPDEADGVTPIIDGAWTISAEEGDDGIPTQVTYTAVTPIADHYAASVGINVIFPESAKDAVVAFPILQQCADGSTDWSQIAEEGQTEDDLESPAPVVTVGAAAADEHGHADADADGDETDADVSGDHDEASASDTAAPVALWLSGGALAISIAALAVALVRRRKA